MWLFDSIRANQWQNDTRCMYKVANVYFLANEILGFDENLTVASSSSDTSAGQRFQSHNRTLEVGSFFRVGGGVHDSYTFHWWDILLPLA